jgi:hypothetical protein
MKKYIIFFIMGFVLINCNDEPEQKLDNLQNIDFSDLEIDINFDSNYFNQEYQVGYKKPDELNHILSNAIEVLFVEQNVLDEELAGLEIKIFANKTIIIPLVNKKGIERIRV